MPTRSQPKDLSLRSRSDFFEVKRQAPLHECHAIRVKELEKMPLIWEK